MRIAAEVIGALTICVLAWLGAGRDQDARGWEEAYWETVDACAGIVRK